MRGVCDVCDVVVSVIKTKKFNFPPWTREAEPWENGLGHFNTKFTILLVAPIHLFYLIREYIFNLLYEGLGNLLFGAFNDFIEHVLRTFASLQNT